MRQAGEKMTGIVETLKRSLLGFVRHFRRSPGLSLLSVLAMALGLACWLLTWIYIHDERGYDGSHRDLDRLYRVGVTFHNEAGTKSFALVAIPVGPALKETFPEVEHVARVLVSNENRRLVRFGERPFSRSRWCSPSPTC